MKKTCSPLIFSFISGIILTCLLGFSAAAQNEESATPIKDEEIKQVLLPETLLDQKGEKVSAGVLAGKFVGLYFSASWCGPCRSFTPSLIKFRDAHKDDFEVILVGADGSSKAQANYMRKYKMPWLAMENQSREAREISKSLGVPHIPYLVVLDPDGKIVSKNGTKEITRLGEEAFTTWKKGLK
jgi:thiol-disulfide isomerase/thioredoxin